MKYINSERLASIKHEIKSRFNSAKPFRYVMFDDFFNEAECELIHNSYPTIKNGTWDGTTYLDQKNKFQKSKFETGSLLQEVFDELNGQEFRTWLQEITELESPILGDDELFGGGLHQSIKGAYLNVHVDYNIHPTTQFHRRLNVIIYMNKDWKDEYEGHLELWDLTENKQELIGKFAPAYNRCVIFETNEISFHGHPKPLNAPNGINRKSIATYYYTETRPENEIAENHNTIYVNTEGLNGSVKRLSSGVKAFLERINKG